MKKIIDLYNVFGRSHEFIFVGVICLCLFLAGCREREIEFYTAEEQAVAEKETKEEQAVPTAEPLKIFVDVCGAVEKPGVYALAEGSRVFHAIKAAGGFAGNAADEYVNRAKALGDGEQIYIPTQEEVQNEAIPALPVQEEKEEIPKVNLNTADKDALMELNGIGESKAEAIITYREEHGSFRSKEDILNVQGIKEGTYEKIKDDIIAE